MLFVYFVDSRLTLRSCARILSFTNAERGGEPRAHQGGEMADRPDQRAEGDRHDRRERQVELPPSFRDRQKLSSDHHFLIFIIRRNIKRTEDILRDQTKKGVMMSDQSVNNIKVGLHCFSEMIQRRW